MLKKNKLIRPVLVCCGLFYRHKFAAILYVMILCTPYCYELQIVYLILICRLIDVDLILICTDCDIGSKEKTKIRNADSNSCNLDPESSIPLLQENKYKVKQWEVIILWSVYIFRL